MSSSKGKSKKSNADPAQKPGPSIRVEETPHKLSRERPFRLNRKERLQNLSPIPPSHSRAASRGPSERGKNLEYLPVLDTTATNPDIGDMNRSVEMKGDLGKSLKPADRWMGYVDRASEDVKEDQPMSNLDEISEQTRQDSIQASKRQVQVKPAISGGVFSENLDKGKGQDNQAEGGAGGLEFVAAIPGHLQDYDNPATFEADESEISRHQMPDIRCPSMQEIGHVSTQGVASHLHGAHHFTIGGNTRFENNRVKNEYNYANHGGTYDIPILKEFVSFNAIHDSSAQDPTRRVHPETRQSSLKRIRDWMDNPRASEPIFWLHGPAGVGKSAIAQTIAHSCAREKLAATFFFYRSDPSRNDGNRLFPTLAWQFAYLIPAIKNALIRSLIERPDICTKAVETQFEELIVKPFLELKRSGIQLSVPVVIIDGVDECSDDSLQRRFLKIIGNAVKDERVPLRFLICTRPEAHIQDTIDIFQSMTLPLDLAKLNDANHDIKKYLKAEFSRIANEQGLDFAWPGEPIIRQLVYKASGQFIYASTVIKSVGDEYNSAETQLDIILGLTPASSISPFGELDELYKETLRRQRDPGFLRDFLSLLIGRDGTGLENLHEDDAMLMNVSEKDLHRKLRGMRSLLKFEPFIDVHHKSFLDFLQDSSRSGQYHISEQAGDRRYLDLIVGLLVRYASTVIEGHDDHKTHFNPRFLTLTNLYPPLIFLPVEEWQQALQPLADLQNKLLTLPDFRSAWEFLPCDECTGFLAMRDLLLHLTFILGPFDRIHNSILMAECHADGSEGMHRSTTLLIPTETDTNAVEKDLNVCLSSLLHQLRRRKLDISLSTDAIQLACSLLHFDHVEIAMRLRSIFDAQNLVDLIDELINNKYFCRDYIPDMFSKAVQLALEISARVPVLPLSLFSEGTVGPHHDVWSTFFKEEAYFQMELLFQSMFMCKILDSSYIVRVSWVYEDYWQFCCVGGKVNENNETLSQWRRGSKPSSVTRIRVMLEVAKAIRYFHSMGIVLHDHVDSDDIFLDSEFHARFRFLGLTARYRNVTPYWTLSEEYISHEANIFLFGCVFYEMCFGIEISLPDRRDNNSNAVATRPSMSEICDDEWQLIQRCCTKERKSRPTIDEVVREMEAWDIS